MLGFCEEKAMEFCIREKERQRFFGWAFYKNTGVKRDRWKWTNTRSEATRFAQFDRVPKKFRTANGRLKRRYTLVLLNNKQQEPTT